MDHRLGRFRPFRQPSLAAHLLGLESGTGARHHHRAVESLLRRLLGERIQAPREDEGLSDLLEVLQPYDPDWAWVHEVHAVMEERSRARASLRLLQCEREPEGAWTGIAVLDELQRASVRRGDAVHGGFLALRDGERLAVYPRVYRQVCSNGAITAGLIHVDVRAEGAGVGEAVRSCLSGEKFAGTVARFQVAAGLEVGDEVRFLARARLDRTPQDVLAAREDQDRTVWGLVNALTTLARVAGDLRERARLERQVENILQAAGIDTRGRRPPQKPRENRSRDCLATAE